VGWALSDHEAAPSFNFPAAASSLAKAIAATKRLMNERD
jgi:hypothetical protein